MLLPGEAGLEKLFFHTHDLPVVSCPGTVYRGSCDAEYQGVRTAVNDMGYVWRWTGAIRYGKGHIKPDAGWVGLGTLI